MASDRGRPTKYDPSLIEKVDEYLLGTGTKKKHLPKVESFALFLNVNKSTLYEWAKRYPDFSDALDKIMERQKQQLIDDGVYEKTSPLIVKLLLMNNHGMREKSELSGDKDNPLSIVFDESLRQDE